MIDFSTLDYLKDGTRMQREAYTILTDHAIMEKLAAFSPVLAGTIPLNIDIPGSDLDIVCQWKDEDVFHQSLRNNFSGHTSFTVQKKMIRGNETTIANFTLGEFAIEVFGQRRSVVEQEAYRHMLIEHRILQERGESFRNQVIELKLQGYKTEPAFAKLLGLPCVDPYAELLAWFTN